jgi:hypothetical protein
VIVGGGMPRGVHVLSCERHQQIPEGYHVDHVAARGCTNRHCFNPAHLEAVPPRENVLRGRGPSAANRRKTHCKWGHELSPENVYSYEGGRRRHCKSCHQLRRLGCHPASSCESEHEARVTFARDHQLVHPDHPEYRAYFPDR